MPAAPIRLLLHHGRLIVALLAAASLSGCDPEAPSTTRAAGEATPPAAQTKHGPTPVAAVVPHDVIAALARLDEFVWLRGALRDTGLAAELSRARGVTLLAPRDTAIVQLGPERINALNDPAARAALTQSLRQLIIPRTLRAEELRTMIEAGGGSVTIAGGAGPLTFTRDAEEFIVTTPDGGHASMGSMELATDNGAIYVLDRWLGH